MKNAVPAALIGHGLLPQQGSDGQLEIQRRIRRVNIKATFEMFSPCGEEAF